MDPDMSEKIDLNEHGVRQSRKKASHKYCSEDIMLRLVGIVPVQLPTCKSLWPVRESREEDRTKTSNS